MNHLLPEMRLEIFSYLSLNEMADCRLVSHSFKIYAEESMKHITHLDLQHERNHPWDRDEDFFELDSTSRRVYFESYTKHAFFSKQFVEAKVRRALPSSVGWKFCAFLGKFCQNLQVLRMDHFRFSCDELVLLGSKLQFFTCSWFIPGSSERTPASLLLQFPNLKGFIDHPNSRGHEYSNSLQRAFLQFNSPVCRIDSEAVANQETVKLLARGGTKCLHLLNWTDPPPFSLSQSMAESLIELTVNFEPTVKFCPFALPNLLYLNLTCEQAIFSRRPNAFISAPRVRCLAYHGPYNRTVDSTQLMSLFNHFEELRVLCIDMKYTKISEKIALPTRLEKLALNILGYKLLEYSSTSLKHLEIGYGGSFSLVCPSLKVLICQGFELRPESMPQLLHSLSKCAKLAKLGMYLWSSRSRNAVSLQPLIDLLSSMTQLSHLRLVELLEYEYQVELEREPGEAHEDDIIHFEEKKFPPLRRLYLSLPTTVIILHLTNSVIQPRPEMLSDCYNYFLKGPDKTYSVGSCRLEYGSANGQELDTLAQLDPSRPC